MKYNILLFGLLFTLVSCQSYLDYDLPDEDKKLVVNALFNQDSTWAVHVSRSMGVVGFNPLKTYTDADVNIYDETGFIEKLTHITDGHYKSPTGLKPLLNHNYTIKVNHADHEPIEGEAALPSPVKIISIDTSTVSGDWIDYYDVVLTFQDQGDVKNYYGIKTFYSEILITDYGFGLDTIETDYEIYLQFDETFFAPDNTIYSDQGILFSDELFDSKLHALNFRVEKSFKYEFGDPETVYLKKEITFELKNLSEEYYRYVSTATKQQWAEGDPFSQPIQVYGNIENGYGIFAGYSSDKVALDLR